MESFCLEKNGATVRYISDIPLKDYYLNTKDKLEFFDAKVISDNKDITHTIYYQNKSTKKVLLVDANTIYISYPFEKLSEQIILYMGYHFLEKQFGEQGLASCHSACVEKDDSATLLIGEAGSGKTSLALNLCQNDNFSLISNDLTLIGLESNTLKAFGGTKFINLRRDSVKENMPSLNHLFQNEEGWSEKVNVLAKEIGLKETTTKKEIKNIITIHTDNRLDNITIKKGDTWRNNFLLYQNLTSHIRGHAATFIDNLGHPIAYIPSFDTEQTYNKRMDIINYINNSPNYYYISGNLKDNLNFINNLYKQKVKIKNKKENIIYDR